MKEAYNSDYFEKQKNSPYAGYPNTNSEVDVVAFMEHHANLIMQKHPAGSSVIDWGCATGIMVDILNKNGYPSIGYDFAQWAFDHRITDQVFLLDATQFDEKAIPLVDIMHSSDFMEHLPDTEILPFLVKTSKRCKVEMRHKIPFYPGFEIPTASPGNIHYTQVKGEWWMEVFSKVPGFWIAEFPEEDYGGYIVIRRLS